MASDPFLEEIERRQGGPDPFEAELRRRGSGRPIGAMSMEEIEQLDPADPEFGGVEKAISDETLVADAALLPLGGVAGRAVGQGARALGKKAARFLGKGPGALMAGRGGAAGAERGSQLAAREFSDILENQTRALQRTIMNAAGGAIGGAAFGKLGLGAAIGTALSLVRPAARQALLRSPAFSRWAFSATKGEAPATAAGATLGALAGQEPEIRDAILEYMGALGQAVSRTPNAPGR